MAKLSTTFVLPLFLAAAACSGADPDTPPPTGEPEGYSEPSYLQMTTTLQLTQSLPPIAKGALGMLSTFDEDPGETIAVLLETADVAVLSDLVEFARDEFKQWINEFLANRMVNGAPVAEMIAMWAQDIISMLSRFEIESTFELGATDVAGGTLANHRLGAVAFEMRGERRIIDTPEVIDQLSMAKDVSCQLSDRSGGGSEIDIGDHEFRLPLGDFLVVAFNAAIEQMTGFASLEAMLVDRVDCSGLAAKIGERCDFCGKIEGAFDEFCRTALGKLAAKVEEQLAEIEYTSLRFSGGSATGIDGRGPNGGRVLERVEAGVWDAELDLNGHVVPVRASFVGQRLDW